MGAYSPAYIENDSVNTILIDEVSSSLMYIGKANPGSATSSAVWRIQQLTPTGLRTVDSGNFSQVWDDRASLSYS